MSTHLIVIQSPLLYLHSYANYQTCSSRKIHKQVGKGTVKRVGWSRGSRRNEKYMLGGNLPGNQHTVYHLPIIHMYTYLITEGCEDSLQEVTGPLQHSVYTILTYQQGSRHFVTTWQLKLQTVFHGFLPL